MNKSNHLNYDVVIVGAGLVGASCAALLTQALPDQKIALIDGGTAPSLPDMTQDSPVFDPRVVALTHASRSVFSSLGLWEGILAQRACAYSQMHVWDDDGTANIHFSAEDIQQEQLGYIVENSVLLCAVLNFIEKQENITVFRGSGVESFTKVADQVSLQCTNGTTLTASLLIAADGGQSKIRELANIDVREWDYEHKAIVATVESEQSHRFTAWQNFLCSGPLAFLPLDHPSERYCSIVWSVENDKADHLMTLSDEDFCQQLGRAFEQSLGSVSSISRRFCFPLTQRHAVDYIDDSVVLIGDAAHTIHPLAGQGVNLGLLDAQALVAELSRAASRQLPYNEPSVLRRYQRQRKGHNLEVMLLMEGFKRLFGSRHIMVRWLRNVGMKQVNQFGLLKNWLAKQAIKNNE